MKLPGTGSLPVFLPSAAWSDLSLSFSFSGTNRSQARGYGDLDLGDDDECDKNWRHSDYTALERQILVQQDLLIDLEVR